MDFTTDGGGGKEVKKNEKGYEREREKNKEAEKARDAKRKTGKFSK